MLSEAYLVWQWELLKFLELLEYEWAWRRKLLYVSRLRLVAKRDTNKTKQDTRESDAKYHDYTIFPGECHREWKKDTYITRVILIDASGENKG